MLSKKSEETAYYLKNIAVMQYVPKIKRYHIESRGKTSVLFISDGVYRYTYNGGGFEAKSGCTVYLPAGSTYTYEVLSDTAHCIQAEFDFIIEAQGNRSDVTPPEHPTAHSIVDAESLFDRLAGRYFNNSLMTLSLLYRILSLIFDHDDKKSSRRKIQPAVDYISRNLCKPVYVSRLAELCDMSASHLRRLFAESYGVSPIRYRNALLAEYACRLLENSSMNVSEIADTLGFADVFTFSSFFKKETGVSPKNYIGKI